MTSQCAPVAADTPLPELLCRGQVGQTQLQSVAALDPFFAALDRRGSGPPLRILQIGDSHTAADAFSGRLRELIQQRFGAAGRGWLPVGVPFAHFNPRLVTVTETGWRHLGPAAAEGLPLGLDAAVAESDRAGARMTLTSTEAEGFDRCAIEFLAEPGGAPLAVRVDEAMPVTVATAAPRLRARRVAVACGSHARQIELSASAGRPLRLLGWTVERIRSGIICENHGTIGATIGLIGQMSQATLAYELADSRPALLVVAFGTNEGFDDALDRRRYAATFRRSVRLLRRLAPGAAVLVLGPPDGSRRDPAGAWGEPPCLAAVRAVQKRVAAEEGWAFWNWAAAMGGAGSIHRLTLRQPPWAFPDHIHLTRLGYAASAEALFCDLVTAYRGWEEREVGGPSPPA